jgi:hypothetical protein
VGFTTPDPKQVWHVSDCSLVVILPLPWQVGQTIFPVPWHVGHSAIAGATFKAEKRKIATNETIKSLFFMSFLLTQICWMQEFWLNTISAFFILRAEISH